MATSVEQHVEKEVARPLRVLVPLIKADFEKAEEAGLPYSIAAGHKLNEAEGGHYEDDKRGFLKWATETFGKSRTQITLYQARAAATNPKQFGTLEKFRRAPKSQGGMGHTASARSEGRVFREWTAPVDAIAERARNEQRRLGEELTRQEERKAEAQLGLRLISIGYKVLAKEFHSDKPGGSKEAMTRLNRVRDRLKANV